MDLGGRLVSLITSNLNQHFNLDNLYNSFILAEKSTNLTEQERKRISLYLDLIESSRKEEQSKKIIKKIRSRYKKDLDPIDDIFVKEIALQIKPSGFISRWLKGSSFTKEYLKVHNNYLQSNVKTRSIYILFMLIEKHLELNQRKEAFLVYKTIFSLNNNAAIDLTWFNPLITDLFEFMDERIFNKLIDLMYSKKERESFTALFYQYLPAIIFSIKDHKLLAGAGLIYIINLAIKLKLPQDVLKNTLEAKYANFGKGNLQIEKHFSQALIAVEKQQSEELKYIAKNFAVFYDYIRKNKDLLNRFLKIGVHHGKDMGQFITIFNNHIDILDQETIINLFHKIKDDEKFIHQHKDILKKLNNSIATSNIILIDFWAITALSLKILSPENFQTELSNLLNEYIKEKQISQNDFLAWIRILSIEELNVITSDHELSNWVKLSIDKLVKSGSLDNIETINLAYKLKFEYGFSFAILKNTVQSTLSDLLSQLFDIEKINELEYTLNMIAQDTSLTLDQDLSNLFQDLNLIAKILNEIYVTKDFNDYIKILNKNLHNTALLQYIWQLTKFGTQILLKENNINVYANNLSIYQERLDEIYKDPGKMQFFDPNKLKQSLMEISRIAREGFVHEFKRQSEQISSNYSNIEEAIKLIFNVYTTLYSSKFPVEYFKALRSIISNSKNFPLLVNNNRTSLFTKSYWLATIDLALQKFLEKSSEDENKTQYNQILMTKLHLIRAIGYISFISHKRSFTLFKQLLQEMKNQLNYTHEEIYGLVENSPWQYLVKKSAVEDIINQKLFYTRPAKILNEKALKQSIENHIPFDTGIATLYVPNNTLKEIMSIKI